MKLTKVDPGVYRCEALSCTIERVAMGGKHTAVGHTWWEITPDGEQAPSALAQTLGDAREFLRLLHAAAHDGTEAR